MLADNLGDLLIGEVAGGDKEALVGRVGFFDGEDVGKCEVADVDPDAGDGLVNGDEQVEEADLQCACRWDLFFGLALNDIPHPLVACVQCIKAVEVVHDWAENERRAHRCDREVGLLLLKEVPCSLLSEGLRRSVAIRRILDGLLWCDGVPVVFAVRVLGPGPLEWVDNAGKRCGDDHALNARRALLDRLQNPCRPNDGGIEELFLHIGDVEMEWAGCVDDGLEWRIALDCFVEGVLLGDVFNDREVKLVLAI
jgi:hypothetical protein